MRGPLTNPKPYQEHTKMAKANNTTARDTYQEITDKIVQALEAGTVPWEKPWRTSGALATPHNPLSGTRYRGINPVLLWMAQLEHGYASAQWATYRQIEQAGGQVRKGEHGETVVFWKWIEADSDEADSEDSDGKTRRRAMLKRYTVFNVDQVDGLDHLRAPAAPCAWQPAARAEATIASSGARIHHGGDRAFFRPTTDEIHLPPRAAFTDAVGYYGTALHELTHWTGHRSRLDRQLGSRFGSEQYAAEELIAELGCAYTCAALGIEYTTQHAAYIAAWLRILKADKRAIFTAAAAAQKAADFIAQFDPLNVAGLPAAA